MGKRCLVLLWLAVSGLSGCRQSPYMSAHLELMNAEKRALEDELYQLEFDYEDAVREVEKLKRENERLRGSSGSPAREPRTFAPRGTRSEAAKDKADQNPELAPPTVDEGMLVEPKIEIPGETPPARELPAPVSPGSPKGPSNQLPTPRSKTPGGSASKASARVFSLEPGDPRVTHIFLNPLLTGGKDLDRQPGDDGIVVVIEPRNRDESFVPLAGPVSVVLLDPAKAADKGRIVARWDVDANDAQKALQNSASVRGIHLRLTWPSGPPTTGRLHLYVRYLTVDNRDLRADRELFITLPGQVTQRWTPRAVTRDPDPSPAKELQAAEEAVVPHDPPAADLTSPATSQESGTSAVARPQWRPYR